MSTLAQACVRKESAVTNKPLLLVRAMILAYCGGYEGDAIRHFWEVNDLQVSHSEVSVENKDGRFEVLNGYVRVSFGGGNFGDFRLTGSISIERASGTTTWRIKSTEYLQVSLPLQPGAGSSEHQHVYTERNPIFLKT